MSGTPVNPSSGSNELPTPTGSAARETIATASASLNTTGEFSSPPEGGVGKLVVLMVTAFIDMVGVLMIIPLMPFYATKLGANGLIVGMLVASFSVAQLISAPMWGRVSDKYGRRPALLIGLSASVIAYLVFAYADSLWLLFLSRLIQGAGGGTVSVVQAYVADVTKPEDRAKSLGWLSAVTNAGVAIGPLIGSWAHHLGRHAPGLFAASLCLINIVFAWRFLVEARKPDTATGKKVASRTSWEAVSRVVLHPHEPSSRLIFIYAIAIGAFQGVTSLLALFLAWRFGVTADTIGLFFLYIGVLSVVMRAFLLPLLLDRFGEARLSRFGLIFLSGGLVGLAFSYDYFTLAISVACFPVGTALTFPCVTAMLSRVTSSNERGLYMGVQQTFGGMSRVLFPVLFGLAWDGIGKPSPFLISAVMVAATLLLGRDLEKYSPRVVKPAAAG
ncbi:MAG: MFS transporter [Gemmatimonadaceae bacterium]